MLACRSAFLQLAACPANTMQCMLPIILRVLSRRIFARLQRFVGRPARDSRPAVAQLTLLPLADNVMGRLPNDLFLVFHASAKQKNI